MKRPKPFWRDMAAPDFDESCADWIAVLPLAAIEQHGPHLPVGVDAIIAHGMINACVEGMPDDLPVTFLPVQEVTKSNEHKGAKGTLTLTWDLVVRNWIDIGLSVKNAGVSTLVMITSHGGNTAPMEIAARELRVEHGLRVITTSWGRLGQWQQVYGYEGPVIDIHGGLCETSLMLALRPDLVDMAQARNFTSDQSRFGPDAKLGWHGAAANMAWQSSDLNAAGVVGDASQALATLGQKDIGLTAKGFLHLMVEIRDEMKSRGALG